MTRSDASKLLTQALKKVESDSIRSWARRQRKVWVQIIQGMSFATEDRATAVSTYITLTAMGA